jgi:hypothetical protein
MINRRLFLSGIATGAFAVAVLAADGAMAQPYGGPPPYQPVPELRHEEILPPRHGYMWEPGHWHWDGRGYVWHPGRYIAMRQSYHRYVPGYWAQRGPRWVWIPAHWE